MDLSKYKNPKEFPKTILSDASDEVRKLYQAAIREYEEAQYQVDEQLKQDLFKKFYEHSLVDSF